MGYTHYYQRYEREVAPEVWRRISDDCKRVCEVAEIPLASWDGTGEPEFTGEHVRFNGRSDCGHAERNLGITWPSPDAKGVALNAAPSGNWFGGAQLSARTCGGDCSHESFCLYRVEEPKPYLDGKMFGFCKTAYKPYDLLVTACLIVAKHHLGNGIRVSSDGESRDWEDARRLCQQVLGYGSEFQLNEDVE